MAAPPAVDPRSGFCRPTSTFHTLRPDPPLPPEQLPLSATDFAFSLLPSPLPPGPALVDAATGAAFSFPELLSLSRSLASGLRSSPWLSPGAVAYVLAPSRLDVALLHFSLLSLGVVVSPGNPASTSSEISHQIRLSKPSVAFATAALESKVPSHIPTIILESRFFLSLLSADAPAAPLPEVRQSDPAAILYSSGTTGLVKGVLLTHRNLIARMAGIQSTRTASLEAAAAACKAPPPPTVSLFTIPLFHVYGFFMLLRTAAMGETTVLMERFEIGAMLRAVEVHRVTFLPVAPPLVVTLAKSDVVLRHDLSSLRAIFVGGAPLGREVAEQLAVRFPGVQITQGYGLTEATGAASVVVGPEEARVYGAVGKLGPLLEAKMVDPTSGAALGPGECGELWLRGPSIMKGYVGDDEATASTLDSKEGWLKTGDVCYFNEDGFLFVVDRLKELIKYKAYQVPPAELEHILHSHPEIADAAVIPYPDEEAGQIPMAFIVSKSGSVLTGEQVMDFVAKQVAPYKKIRRAAFVNLIPKSAAGKILRRELVNRALSMRASKL